jgi:hypothetical protein
MRFRLIPTLVTLLCLLPGLARAAPHGTALVVGIGTYDNKPLLPACIRIAHAVSAHLRGSGFSVDELIDPDGIVLRSAVGDFADAVLSKNPSAPALIYVCARAATLDHRIFLLPADATPQAMLRLQTEGTVLRAFMNTFTGNNAMLVADLGMSANAADIAATAQDRPDALHVALRAGLGDQLGTFGERLAATPLDVSPAASGSDSFWNGLDTTLRAGADAGPGVAVAVTPSPAAATPSPAVVAEQKPPPAPPPQPAAPPTRADALPPGVTAAPLPSATASTAAPASTPPAPSIAAAQPTATAATATAAASPKPNAPPPKPAPPENLASASQPPTHRTPPPAPPTRMAQASYADSRISRIQEALARRGFYHGAVDGISTPRTTSAIRAFQNSLGDSPTGGLTQIEVVKLLNVW